MICVSARDLQLEPLFRNSINNRTSICLQKNIALALPRAELLVVALPQQPSAISYALEFIQEEAKLLPSRVYRKILTPAGEAIAAGIAAGVAIIVLGWLRLRP